MNIPHINGENSRFWQINIGHIGAIAIFLATAFVGYGRLSSQFENMSVSIAHDQGRLDKMDESDVQTGQKGALDHQILMAHETRLQKTEDLISQVGVMKEKIDRISDDIKEIKDRK